MPTNTNCLLGVRCPGCGHESRFYISSVVTAEVTDNGAIAAGDIEWYGDSRILCPECECDGKLSEFSRPRFTAEDADRLLQIGDEFLSDWAEDALRGSQRDADHEERVDEWKAIRPLLAAASLMQAALQLIAEDEEACTCRIRSWYGKGHDTQCPVRIAADAFALATRQSERKPR